MVNLSCGKINMVKKVVLFILIFVILFFVGIVAWYQTSIGSVNNEDTTYTVEIAMGSGSSAIATQLEKQGIIKSALAFKIYVRLNNITNFQAGTYQLSKNMTVEDIISVLQTGKVGSKDVISITFLEGKNMRWIAEKIEEETNNTEEQVFELLEDEEYLNSIIEDYWFITDEIMDNDIYYPLEGYLFPDTYQFDNKDVTVEEIFEKMLKQMDTKLSKYKKEIDESEYTVHEILTMASIIENEAMFDKDRKDVASVFYNRLGQGMSLGSDVTTYYAIKVDIGERDLYKSEINTYNAYNTRGPNMNGKLPIGPISTIGTSSIEAAIEPNETSYLFFVADKNGNVYYTRTNEEHNKKVNELKNSGLWFEF